MKHPNFLAQVVRALRYATGENYTQASLLGSTTFARNLGKHQHGVETWKSQSMHGGLFDLLQFGAQGFAYCQHADELPDPRDISEPKYQACPYTRAAIDTLGQSAIQSAQQLLLGPEFDKLSKEFCAGDARIQRQVLGKLYRYIRYGEKEKHAKKKVCHGFGDTFEDYYNQTINRMFPYLIHSLGEVPNCLGTAIRLIAFARQCGAKVYFASPIASSHLACHATLTNAQVLLSMAAYTHQMIFDQDIDGYRDVYRNKRVLSGLWASNFHAGIAIQLDDGTWYLLDPYLGAWGEIPDFDLVDKYISALEFATPGYSMESNSGLTTLEIAKAEMDRVLAQADDAIGMASKLADDINDAIETCPLGAVNVDDSAVIISRSAIFEFFCRKEGISQELIEELGGPEAMATVLMSVPFGGDIDRLYHEANSLSTAIHHVRKYPLDALLEDLREALDQKCDSGEMIHPVCEYSAANYQVGLRLLRELAASEQEPNLDLLRITVDESSTQLAVHDGISFFDSSLSHLVAGVLPVPHESVSEAVERTTLTTATPDIEEKRVRWLKNEAQRFELASFES